MSYTVDGTTITLTRGDTFKCRVDMYNKETGDPYIPSSEDVIRFAVKHTTMTADKSEYTDQNALISKEIPYDTQILTLDPEDTKPLGFGTYVYDVELTKADGTVDTFITKAKFKLTEEV